MKTLEKIVAERLVALKAIKLQPISPFKWGNGWNSPIYCDDRRGLSYPKERDFLKLELSRIVAEQFPETDVIAGIATNAIAHGVLVAHQLSLPFVYVYSSPKDHGLENQIEGDLRPKQNVVVIENQVAIADSSIRVIEALRNNGCNVLGVVTILDYELEVGHNALKEAGVPLVALTTFSAVIETAAETGYISKQDVKMLNDWHKHPAKWKKQNVRAKIRK
ncbi:MAG: orotate phosphoribosyltransferase [Elusimicrobiaceae bacterium]|nr:orotate phosphoribosyltransferase [Elusimicrobiaceae bacterium]